MTRFANYRPQVDPDGVRRRYVAIPIRLDDEKAMRAMMKKAGKGQFPKFVGDLLRQFLRMKGLKRYEDPIYEERRNSPSVRLIRRKEKMTSGSKVEIV